MAAQGGGWGDGGAALEGGRQWEAVLGWVKGRGGPAQVVHKISILVAGGLKLVTCV